MSSSFKHINFYLIPLIFLCFLLISCNPTKYIPKDGYLLNKTIIVCDNPFIQENELRNYLKQKPNKKFLGFKIYLGVYNLSKKDKSNKINNLLKKIGEEPVIFDEFLTQKTTKQFELYVRNKGYYNSKITDSIVYKKRQATVFYNIHSYKPYIIGKINYIFDDTTLCSIIYSDTLNRCIQSGMHLDVDILQNERKRIEDYLKTKGYYDFVRQYISYDIDTANNNFIANITIHLNNYSFFDSSSNLKTGLHKLYKIHSIYLMPNYEQNIALSNPLLYSKTLDTVIYKGIDFITSGRNKFNKEILYQSVFITPGKLYNIEDVKKTYDYLSSLKLYKLINIQFKKTNKINFNNPFDTAFLDCQIQLSPSNLQSYSFELEGTNSSGNLGGALNLVYTHKNVFNGFEWLEMKFTGAYEATKEKSTTELGAEARLNINKFLLPFRTTQFIKKYNPKTAVTLAYNYQKRPIYTRTIGNFEFGYNWKSSSNSYHLLNPFEFNIVDISNKEPDFFKKIDSTYLAYSYQRHVMCVTRYTYIFNNHDIIKRNNVLIR